MNDKFCAPAFTVTYISPAICGLGDDKAVVSENLVPARNTAVPSVTDPPSIAVAYPAGSDDAVVPPVVQKNTRPEFVEVLITCPDVYVVEFDLAEAAESHDDVESEGNAVPVTRPFDFVLVTIVANGLDEEPM